MEKGEQCMWETIKELHITDEPNAKQEVDERPSSVAEGITENAIDAGSTGYRD